MEIDKLWKTNQLMQKKETEKMTMQKKMGNQPTFRIEVTLVVWLEDGVFRMFYVFRMRAGRQTRKARDLNEQAECERSREETEHKTKSQFSAD